MIRTEPHTSSTAPSVAVIVNEVSDVVASQTTAMLIAELASREVRVLVTGVADLGLERDGSVIARVVRPASADDLEGLVAAMRACPRERERLTGVDGVLIRTNPARDPRAWAHAAALELCRHLRADGSVVINDPDGLALAASKLFLSRLPEWTRPASIATAYREELIDFVRQSNGGCVVKPAVGTRGDDVFRVFEDDANLRQIVDVTLRSGYAIAQAFVPEASEGDARVLILDGELLVVDGEPAVIRRVPAEGDFRSNIHAGGTARPAQLTAGVRRVVEHIGPLLCDAGLWFCGLDFLGDLVCEVNVFSTGGLRDAERFTGRSFSSRVIDAMLARIRAQ